MAGHWIVGFLVAGPTVALLLSPVVRLVIKETFRHPFKISIVERT